MTTGFNFEADPGRAAPTLLPGPPETREINDTTPNNLTARRRLLIALAGGGAVAAAGVGWRYFIQPGTETDYSAVPEATKSPEQTKPRGDFNEVPRVFYGPNGEPLELRREDIKLPDTLDPPTLEQAFANVAEAVQYYVNSGDLAGIQSVVPGTTDIDAMSPGQLYMRSVFIQRFRKVYGDAFSDSLHTDDPENMARHYAWGFRVQLLEQTDQLGADIKDTEMVTGKVRVAFGDYRPEINGHHRRWEIEKPQTYEGTMTITRYSYLGLNARLPNNGWGIYRMSFPQLPPRILQSPPPGYEKPPLLYPGLGR